MSQDDTRYIGILLEELRDQNKTILEHIGALPTLYDFSRLEQQVGDLQADVQIIRAAVTDQSHQLADQERRISQLEVA
jgi:hypothetical protein